MRFAFLSIMVLLVACSSSSVEEYEDEAVYVAELDYLRIVNQLADVIESNSRLTNSYDELYAEVNRQINEKNSIVIQQDAQINDLQEQLYLRNWQNHAVQSDLYELIIFVNNIMDVSLTSYAPTDIEFRIFYERAREALSWILKSTMPGEPVEPVLVYGMDFWVDVAVVHPEIENLMDLMAHFYAIFSPDFVDALDIGGRFADVDSALHTVGADRGSNIFAGEIRHEIRRVSDTEVVYVVHVDIHEDAFNVGRPSAVSAIKVSEFLLIYEDGQWRFQNFHLVV